MKREDAMCVATNSDGSDKLPLMFIGTSVEPLEMRGHDWVSELGVVYTNTSKAWMTSRVFLIWLQALNVRMEREGRKILSLVDNVSTHTKVAEQMPNVRLEFLPPNTASHLQPMNHGVIANLKRHYEDIKNDISIQRYLNHEEVRPVYVFTAMRWAKMAWDRVSAETIRNCWGILVCKPQQNVSGS